MSSNKTALGKVREPVRYRLTLTASLSAALDRHAAQIGVPVPVVIERILRQWINERDDVHEPKQQRLPLSPEIAGLMLKRKAARAKLDSAVRKREARPSSGRPKVARVM